MDPEGTPALTGYSCEDFASRTTWSFLLLRKEEIRPNIWPEIPQDLSIWRRPMLGPLWWRDLIKKNKTKCNVVQVVILNIEL